MSAPAATPSRISSMKCLEPQPALNGSIAAEPIKPSPGKPLPPIRSGEWLRTALNVLPLAPLMLRLLLALNKAARARRLARYGKGGSR